MIFRRYFPVIVLLLAAGFSGAATRKVLFIGNSYTYTNSMPSMLQAFAAAGGDTLIFNQSDPGGYTLEEHSTYGPTLSLIFSQPWDIVVLQEQSELPSFPPDQVDTAVYPYAHILDSMIHANDSCTETMFMMTWGHADGDPPNCPTYSVICTYAGMQGRLRESYLQMTQMNNAIVAPVGAAWEAVRDSFPTLWLYQADSIHPSLPGSYLQTCVLYSSIFHKRATGSSYLGGVTLADASILQRIADEVTMDSLWQWQQYGHYPYAGFTYSAAGRTVAFAGGDPIAAAGSWSFGDGGTDTAAHPTHTYSATGSYIVTHTVSNACFSESVTDTITIVTTGIAGMAAPPPAVTVGLSEGGATLSCPAGAYDRLLISAIDGRSIGEYPFAVGRVTLPLAPGSYVYRAYNTASGVMLAGRFAAY